MAFIFMKNKRVHLHPLCNCEETPLRFAPEKIFRKNRKSFGALFPENRRGLKPAIFLTKNRRADISITILVIGVFLICTLAIVSFVLSLNQTEGNFANPDVVENLSSNLDIFYFYVHSGMPEQQAAALVGAQIQGNQIILNAQQMNGNTQILSVKYVTDLSN